MVNLCQGLADMRKIITVTVILCCLCLLVTACGANYDAHKIQTTPETLEDVLAIALARRQALQRPNSDRIAQFTEGRAPVPDALPASSVRLQFGPRIISTEDVLYDIDVFFSALRGLYALYIYYGGDDVFLPLWDGMIETVNTQPEWSRQELEYLFYTKLSYVIIDEHFIVPDSNAPRGSASLGRNYGFFTYDGRFDKSAAGFVNQAGLYVRQLLLPCRPCMVLDPQDIFRLSMDETGGSFFYVPIVIADMSRGGPAPKELTIVYECGQSETVGLRLLEERAAPPWAGGLMGPSIEYVQDVPVLIHRGGFTLDYEAIVQFLDTAELLRDEPVFILDLRGNGGGVSTAMDAWFYRLTGQYVPRVFHGLFTYANTWELSPQEGYTTSLERFKARESRPTVAPPYVTAPSYNRFDENHMIVNNPPHEIVSRDQLMIILVDGQTGSAAEWMMGHVFSMENTLVVGQNTMGCMLSGGTFNLRLPNSAFLFRIPNLMTIFPEGFFQESVGIAPDIWVAGCALEAALGMINTHFFQQPAD